MTQPPKSSAGAALSADEIRRIVGDISDARVLAILGEEWEEDRPLD